MSSSPAGRPTDSLISIEQLRDLYERIPFARGPARVALLHRLRGVTTEVRKTRALSGHRASTALVRTMSAARARPAATELP